MHRDLHHASGLELWNASSLEGALCWVYTYGPFLLLTLRSQLTENAAGSASVQSPLPGRLLHIQWHNGGP